jgi:hypothetical protein
MKMFVVTVTDVRRSSSSGVGGVGHPKIGLTWFGERGQRWSTGMATRGRRVRADAKRECHVKLLEVTVAQNLILWETGRCPMQPPPAGRSERPGKKGGDEATI